MSTKISQDASLIDRARQLAAIDTLEGLRREAGTDDNLAALVNFWGAARIVLGELASAPDDDGSEDQDDDEDRLGEYDEDEDWEPFCAVPGCGASVGIFVAHGDAWLHYTGQGTKGSPVDLFDAGHEPAVAWRPATSAS